METFHCSNPESRQSKIVSLVSRLITYEVAFSDEKETKEFPVHYIGSQIVQALLNFNKPIRIVQSLLDMDTSELRDLLCDSCGSHVMDAFVSAEFVGEKSREKLLQKIQVCVLSHEFTLPEVTVTYLRFTFYYFFFFSFFQRELTTPWRAPKMVLVPWTLYGRKLTSSGERQLVKNC